MNLLPLYAKQMELEQFVRKNIGMTEEEFTSVDMIDNRIFAFKVEFGELSNEHGWFKYWKRSHQIDREATLEELVDCVHFLLAIGLYRKYHRFVTELNYQDFVGHSFSELYNNVMENSIKSTGQWMRAFEMLIAIGLKLGYTIGQIETAYYMKNKKNIERQKANY